MDLSLSSPLTGCVALGKSLDFNMWDSPVVNGNNGTSQTDKCCWNLEFNFLYLLALFSPHQTFCLIHYSSLPCDFSFSSPATPSIFLCLFLNSGLSLLLSQTSPHLFPFLPPQNKINAIFRRVVGYK